ncbi:MAG TPA: phenylalanine 4-monooxygenase [Acidimicrobiales bacterium]|nr:phenylalanine 4-monooxygenase [Acidimicrobiales bacterium]
MDRYRSRRDELAGLAHAWSPGDPIPEPAYTDEEHEVWRVVSAALAPRHAARAAREVVEAGAALGLPTDHVPQLGEVGEALAPLSGFRYLPVAGLAPLREFYGSFAGGVFWSTQYLRHPAAPLYTPEPDLVHEVIGHATQLAHPGVADLYRRVGAATARTSGDAALRFLSRVFWFSIEFGVVVEGGRPKAFGAGLLSSVGELDAFTGADIRPADLVEMGTAVYDISRFQPVLYSFASVGELCEVIGEFVDGYDDDAHSRLAGDLAAAQ